MTLSPPAANAQPSLPHYFYGTVKINNIDAPVGTTIEARVTGALNGTFNPIVTTEAGKYGSADPSANVPRLLVQGNILEGATIEFFVNGTKANETAAWYSSRIQSLNLTITAQLGNLDHVALSSATAFLQPGATRQFTALAYDQSDNVIPGLTYTWTVVSSGGSIDGSGLFTAGGATGTFVNTVQAEASYGGVTRQGTATVVIGPSMTVTTTLQGPGRASPAGQDYRGYNVPLTVKLYNEAVTNVNIKTLAPVANGTFSTADGNIVIIGANPTTKVITFTVGALPVGTYSSVTLYSPHNLVNLKNNVIINADNTGTTLDMGTLLEGDAQDIAAGSVVIDIQDFVAFGNAYETSPGMANWNAGADFDRNGWVRITDFGLLYQNYGKTSPQTVP